MRADEHVQEPVNWVPFKRQKEEAKLKTIQNPDVTKFATKLFTIR